MRSLTACSRSESTQRSITLVVPQRAQTGPIAQRQKNAERIGDGAGICQSVHRLDLLDEQRRGRDVESMRADEGLDERLDDVLSRRDSVSLSLSR